MRYFQKLLCLLILVLAASFGVGGCVLLYSDFSVQRSRMAAANAAAHAQACTLLQTEILDLQRRGISTGDAALTARVTAQNVPAALWRGDTLVCATLEGLQSLPPWRRRHRDRQDRKFHLLRLRQRPAGRAAARHSLRPDRPLPGQKRRPDALFAAGGRRFSYPS